MKGVIQCMKKDKKNKNEIKKEITNPISEETVEKVVEQVLEQAISEERKKGTRINWNNSYLTISLYAVFVIVSSVLLIYLLINFKQTKNIVFGFLNAISPFIVAILIALFINPLVKRIDKLLENKLKVKSKGLRIFISMAISYILIVGGVIILIIYITPKLVESITDLISQQALAYERIFEYVSGLYEKYPDVDFDAIYMYVENKVPEILKQATQILSGMIPKLYLLSVSIVKVFMNLLLSIVISCYIILDKKNLKYNSKRFVFSVLSKDNAKGFLDLAAECINIFNKFFIGKFIDSLIIGIICYVVMLILQLPYSILLSIIVGITNMIPYFGPFIGAVPGILIYLLIDPIKALVFAVMILVLQQFDGLYLGPKILGESIGIKPLWIIFSITIGGIYAGVLGMLFAVPVFAVITYIIEKIISKRLNNKNIVIEKDHK